MQFVELLLHEKEILFNVISEMFAKEKIDNPYSVDDFDVSAAKITEDVLTLRIGFPEPEVEPLCYCAYMFFDERFEKVSYFCIEKGSSWSDNYPFVCSWTPDEDHHNYGNCTFEEHNDFIRCADIHMEREYGLTRKDDRE